MFCEGEVWRPTWGPDRDSEKQGTGGLPACQARQEGLPRKKCRTEFSKRERPPTPSPLATNDGSFFRTLPGESFQNRLKASLNHREDLHQGGDHHRAHPEDVLDQTRCP